MTNDFVDILLGDAVLRDMQIPQIRSTEFVYCVKIQLVSNGRDNKNPYEGNDEK